MTVHRPIYAEVPSDDPARARKFYEQLFGWTFRAVEAPVPYWVASTGEGAGIDVGLFVRGEGFDVPCLVVDVADIDRAAERFVALGGQVVMPKSPLPGQGWTVYGRDPEGTMIGMIQFDPPQ